MASTSLKIRTFIGAGMALLVLATIGMLAWWSTTLLRDANGRVNHTREVIVELDRVRVLTRQVEIQTEAGVVPEIDTIVVTMRDYTARLGRLTAENPAQQQRVATLAEAVQLFESGPRVALAVHDSAEHVQAILEDMTAVENSLLIERLQNSHSSAMRVTRILAILTFAGGALLAVAFFIIYRQTQREMRLEKGRIDAEEQMRVVVDRMLAGLITVDLQARIETINPAAETMFGYSAEELVGRSIKTLMAATGDEARAVLRQLPGTALGKVTEWDARRKDGTTFPMELSLFAFETGGTRHLAGYVRDISERREVERMKDEFVSVVSHELRTPLTSIRGALQLVLADPPQFKDEEHEPLLDIALSNAERLIRLVNDILDVSKIEAGQVQLRRRHCEVFALIRSSVDTVAEFARASSVEFTVDCDRALKVNGDADRLVQVLTNLLSNAVKFSGERSTVHVSGHLMNNTIEIVVADHGQGIPADELAQLFGKFRQLDSSTTRHRGGTGLGLTISKALVEQHGGSIGVRSEVGHGSTFVVTLPALIETTPPAAAVTEAPSSRPGGGLVILAEDDDDLREVMAQTLSRRGFRVLSAPNGDVARSLYDTTACDALVVDLHMPVGNGFDLIAHVRRGERGQTLPILVVSGSNTGQGEHRSILLGANVFFTKPVDPDQLVFELHRLMNASPRS